MTTYRPRKLMRILTLSAVALLGSATAVLGQDLSRDAASATGAVLDVDAIERMDMPSLDLHALQLEDAQREIEGLPPRFAVPQKTMKTPDKDGTWEDLGDGTHMWRLRIVADSAASLNLGFTRYWMPEGGQLTVYATDGSQIIRPFTAVDNAEHGQLWTPVVLADDIIVEVIVPADAVKDLELELTSINTGYRGFGELPFQSMLLSGSCNVDVVCPEGDLWEAEIAAVGVISTGGSTFCTGFMVNNTANDLTPYFMTADHCGIGSSNAASLVVYWNYENSTCRPVGSPSSGGAGDGSLSQFQTGSFFRAGYSTSDMTLVELDSDPDPNWEVAFAGWDRSGVDATSAIAIHHPNTDEKRISYEDDPTTVTSYLGSTVPGDNTHVRVEDWDLGTTEPGSSGSPLFDQNHRVIGQLHGGFAACGNDDSDWYGRFHISWAGGGTSSTRLSNWLDPGDTGAMTVDTISSAGMTVTPAGDVDHLGAVGGPFTNATTIYTLSNSTPDPISYQVSLGAGDAPLLLDGGVAPVTGTLSGSGGTVDVVVTLDSPETLAAGIYSTPVVFDDLTNARQTSATHTIEVGQTEIDVTPLDGLITGGPVGGPFTGATVYTITSAQPSPVTVMVTASDPWISLNGVAGPLSIDLNGGIGDSANVTVGISSAANALAAGIYNGSVSFVNTDSGNGDATRDVDLEVGRTVYVPIDVPKAIADNSEIVSKITVPDSFCIGDVDVDMDITHTYTGDLIVELESPSGVIVRLHDRSGGTTDDIVTTYDDDGAGTAPDGPGVLSDFDYGDSQGTWILTVSDNAGGDTGTLNDWALRIAAQGGVCPTPELVYEFTFDTDPGWATEGQWAFGTPTGGGGSSGDPDPTSGYTGSNVFGYNLSGDYANGLSSTLYLTSTAIDCSNITGTRLMFRRWLGVESATFDHANIEVSNNGVSWTTVWDHTGSALSDGAWTLASYDISGVADGQSTVYVRWGMGSTDGSVTYCGWNIDDVEIWGVLPSDCAGDLDGSGDVNSTDLAILLGNFGVTSGALPEDGDMDGDGDVDSTDLAEMLAVFGSTCS